MKKFLTLCVLGLFLVGATIGCSSSPSTGGTGTTEKKETKKDEKGTTEKKETKKEGM